MSSARFSHGSVWESRAREGDVEKPGTGFRCCARLKETGSVVACDWGTRRVPASLDGGIKESAVKSTAFDFIFFFCHPLFRFICHSVIAELWEGRGTTRPSLDPRKGPKDP